MREWVTQTGFILHVRPFKESQALVDLVIEQEGRISAIVSKGGAKNSAKNALIQPFRPLTIQVKPGAGLRKLKQIESHSSLPNLQLTGKALFCGFYINEVICRLCAIDEPNDELLALYSDTLYKLSQLGEPTAVQLETTLRRFEYRLLAMLGYGFSFAYTYPDSDEVKPNGYYTIEPEAGLVPVGKPELGILGLHCLQLETQLASDQPEYLDTALLAPAKILLRQCLSRHLGDKPLKSRELFRK